MKQLSVEDFITQLTSTIFFLCGHHYISKHESAHLKTIKEEIKPEESIILLDFAENYSFMFQDAAQGSHWDNR